MQALRSKDIPWWFIGGLAVLGSFLGLMLTVTGLFLFSSAGTPVVKVMPNCACPACGSQWHSTATGHWRFDNRPQRCPGCGFPSDVGFFRHRFLTVNQLPVD